MEVSGIPGVVYEVSDDKQDFTWKLLKEKKSDKKIANPFPKESQFISYENYPKLRYALSPELEQALSKNPNRTIFEQPRVDIEISFENEKK